MNQLLWILAPVILLFAMVVGILVFTAAFTLVERKLMGLHQRREGPDRVGFEGLGQPFSDGLKLLRKETLLPKDSPEGRVFFLAPLLSLWVSLLLWTLVPTSPAGPFVAEEVGLLLVLGLSSLGSYGVIYAGWASNNKYALLGAFRAVAQFISYEIVFSLLFLPLVGVTGSANLQSLVDYQVQEGWFSYLVPLWGLCFIVVLAETNRTPFDLPEAEAELVAGFNVEYSSLLFAFFFLAEYSAMGFFAALLVTLFFGGYSLLPLGWGFDNSRPVDGWFNHQRTYGETILNTSRMSMQCSNVSCDMAPRHPYWGKLRIHPMSTHDSQSTQLQFLKSRSLLRILYCQQADYINELSVSITSVEEEYNMPSWKLPEPPSLINVGTNLDALFGSSVWYERPRFSGRPLTVSEPLMHLFRLWDVGLLYPVHLIDSVMHIAIFPGLVAVPLLALKVQLLCLTFILVRASLPRLRFDQLTLLCWKYLFPLALSGSLMVLGLHYGFTTYFMAMETKVRDWDLNIRINACVGTSCLSPEFIAVMKVLQVEGLQAVHPIWDLDNGLPLWKEVLERQSSWRYWLHFNLNRSWFIWSKQPSEVPYIGKICPSMMWPQPAGGCAPISSSPEFMQKLAEIDAYNELSEDNNKC